MNEMLEEIFKNKYYKLIRENLSTIIIIPTILGGIWQIILLGNIGFSYIKFFSITQVIADGLLILISIIIVLVSFYIWSLILDKIYTIDSIKIESKRWVNIILCASLSTSLLILKYLPIDISSLISIGIVGGSLWISYIDYRKEMEESPKNYIKYSLIFLLFLALLLFIKTIVYLNTLPKEITNLKYLGSKIEYSKKVKYMSDKFIFIENKDNEIEILKTDDLFNQETCK